MTAPGDTSATPAAPAPLEELVKEAATMALYVAVSSYAALLAVPDDHDAEQRIVIALIWGTTLGLALAHWFAFQVSARLVGGGRLALRDLWISLAQLGGAAMVAVAVTLPVVLLPASAELDVARLVLAGLMALVGYGVAWAGGHGRLRSIVGAAVTLAIAVAVAVVKNRLGGH